MKTLNILLGFFIIITWLFGCSVKRVDEPLQNTTTVRDKQEPLVGDKQETPKEDFIPGFHPFKDDPDNPSPHNPLIKKFGDIPEVRTYIRLQRKFRYGIGLNVDEAIELYTAEAHLYPSLEAKARLKSWKKDKERYERLGILTDEPVMRYGTKSDTGAEVSGVNEASD